MSGKHPKSRVQTPTGTPSQGLQNQEAPAEQTTEQQPPAKTGAQSDEALEVSTEGEEGASHAVFHVSLQLGDNNEVRETSVTYHWYEANKPQRKHKRWQGRRVEELCAFIREQIAALPAANLAAPAAEVRRPAATVLPPPPTELDKRTRELAFVPAADGEALKFIAKELPCRGRLTLHLADLPPAIGSSGSYDVVLRAKRLGSGTRVLLSEVKGVIQAEEFLVITSDARFLPPGLWRLEALVTFESDRSTWPPPGDLPLRGQLVLVY